MRWPWPLVLAALAGGACHATPRPPEQPSWFAVAPDHAALPPYGGAVWSAPCSAALGIASVAERNARRAAMETWFPGSSVTLTPLGDRARVLHLPGRGPAPRDALALGKRVIELAAPLFGLTDVRRWSTGSTRAELLVEVELRTTDFTRSPGETAVPLLAAIDRESGDILIGLVEEVLPILPACRHAPPPVDVARATAAVAALAASTDIEVATTVAAEPAYGNRESRGVVTVFVRHDRSVIHLDAVTYAVLHQHAREVHDVFDPAGVSLDPAHDVRRAFGTAPRRYRHH